MTTQEFVLKATCNAASGIVANVTTHLFNKGCYFKEISQYDNEDTKQLFMRLVARVDGDKSVLDGICDTFSDVADKFGMEWEIFDTAEKPKVIIMVSKFDHCLNDLLYRVNKGDLNIDIKAIVSNHLDARPMAEREGIRFIHLPVNKENKAEQEAELLKIFYETGSELIILARYMQILSNELSTTLSGRVINIHHSFLPGFKGAKPYHQAYERGVKLIGATAHYVTANLDEGPIIEQAVQPVDHTYLPDDLVRVGRDTEMVALARAVKQHIEHRVFLDGNKTVILKSL